MWYQMSATMKTRILEAVMFTCIAVGITVAVIALPNKTGQSIYSVIAIDKCEYIKFTEGEKFAVIHKADCKNVSHRPVKKEYIMLDNDCR